MLSQLNRMLEKLMPFITPVSLLIGVLIGSSLSQYTFLIPWLFALMTFAGSLNSNIQQLNATIHRPFPIVMALFVLHIFMPAGAWSVG
ncbi:bile acid:sodium symporter family protein, partial [Priestia megaterium]|nr:bile acid:sodium symporter family protein [Priestia megaterium]